MARNSSTISMWSTSLAFRGKAVIFHGNRNPQRKNKTTAEKCIKEKKIKKTSETQRLENANSFKQHPTRILHMRCKSPSQPESPLSSMPPPLDNP